MARGLDSPCLMAVDMSGAGAQRALVGTQSGGDDNGVGLGAPHQEVNVGLRRPAGRPDQGSGPVTVGVQAVSRGLLVIGGGQGRQDGGVAALGVVAFKVDHIILPFSGGRALCACMQKAACIADGSFGFPIRPAY